MPSLVDDFVWFWSCVLYGVVTICVLLQICYWLKSIWMHGPVLLIAVFLLSRVWDAANAARRHDNYRVMVPHIWLSYVFAFGVAIVLFIGTYRNAEHALLAQLNECYNFVTTRVILHSVMVFFGLRALITANRPFYGYALSGAICCFFSAQYASSAVAFWLAVTVLSIVALSIGWRHRIPWDKWNIIYLIYVCVLVLLLLVVLHSSKSERSLGNNTGHWQCGNAHVTAAREPLVCSARWEGLDIVEIALLAAAAYKDPSVLKLSSKIECVAKDTYSRVRVLKCLLNTKGATRLVVAIRGTDAWHDWVQNLRIWGPSVLFRLFAGFIPGSHLLMTPTIQSSLIAFLTFSLPSEDHYLQALKDFALFNGQNYSLPQIIVTGHSLGGGLAQQLAARNPGLRVLTFSAPGITTAEAAAEPSGRAENVVPDWDLVPHVDLQSAVQYRIPCDEALPFHCHKITTTIQTFCKICSPSTFALDDVKVANLAVLDA